MCKHLVYSCVFKQSVWPSNINYFISRVHLAKKIVMVNTVGLYFLFLERLNCIFTHDARSAIAVLLSYVVRPSVCDVGDGDL